MNYFYILVDPDRPNVHKVGITKNPQSRIRSYRTSAPSAYFHKIYKIPKTENIKKHEKEILYHLSGAFKTRAEVVSGPLKIIENIIDDYWIDHGLL